MRGNLSDQDLTDYALNELQPEERLYLESMFAVSESCRQDIYGLIELGQLLEEGYEAEETMVCSLTEPQREQLLGFRQSVPIWHQAAIAVGMAACAAFVLTHPGFWQVGDSASKVAQVSTQMSKIVAAAVAPEHVSFAGPLANLAVFAEDSTSWLPAEVIDPVCTPPTGLEAGALGTLVDMTP